MVGRVRAWFAGEVGGIKMRVHASAFGAAEWAGWEGGELALTESLSRGVLVFSGERDYGMPGMMTVWSESESRPWEAEAFFLS
ncbi:MAG: hypothetical protein EA351_00510 [Gemmatimonadales bacterium]|nr:MAG: hypothetical protein EA351_00510 [Gemmatimonadales bacterium]